MKNFRTYELAVTFYQRTVSLRLAAHMKNQLLRSASSIAVNLAEGYGKTSSADQTRYFEIAYASCKESQAWLELGKLANHEVGHLADTLGAHIYRLKQASRR